MMMERRDKEKAAFLVTNNMKEPKQVSGLRAEN